MTTTSHSERGVILLLALFALVIVSAIAMSLMFAADTETSVNANYRDSVQAYYGARAGVEEGRERLQAGSVTAPTTLPSSSSGTGVMYILNPDAISGSVQPWVSTSKYFDDQLCHDGFPGLGLTVVSAGTRCTVSAGTNYYTSATSNDPNTGTSAALSYRWVRISKKINRSTAPYYVNGSNGSTTLSTEICFDGAKELLLPSGNSNCGVGGYGQLYEITSLAVTPSGSRRMLMMDTAPAVPVSVRAAIYTNGSLSVGDALNVTGNAEPTCNSSTIGAVSGSSTVTTPGSGNVTGSPQATQNNGGFPYNVSALMSALQANALAINTSGTGVTGSGTPATYSGSQVSLGTPPTVTYDSSYAIRTITQPGTPATYYSPADLTLGTHTVGGTGINGYGVLLVRGNLTMDVTNGFNYFGLILVTGNITMSASSSTSVNPSIHGTIIAGGAFSAPISNMSGSISVHQNSCMVSNALATSGFKVIALREVMY